LLFLLAIVAGLGVGLLMGGRLQNLALLRFRWPWLIVGAIVVSKRRSVVVGGAASESAESLTTTAP